MKKSWTRHEQVMNLLWTSCIPYIWVTSTSLGNIDHIIWMQDVYFFWMYFSVIVAVSDPPGSLQWTFNFQELKRWSSWRKLPWIYARFSELVEHCLFCFEINGGVCWLKSAWEWFLLWSVCSWKINISWYQIFWICQVFPSGLCRGGGRIYLGKQLLLKNIDHP